MSISDFIFWNLPYNTRQYIYKYARKDRFKRYKTKNEGETDLGYSFVKYHELRCIYVHIPKCGGISIAHSLFGNMGGGHIPLKSYQLFFTKQQFESYFKFAIVRNPWDRLVSAYLFLKKGGINERDKLWAEKHLSEFDTFEKFVKEWITKKKFIA